LHQIGERREVDFAYGHPSITFTKRPMHAHPNPPNKELVLSHARAAGATIDEGPAEKLARWMEQLVDWNTRLDLTAARSTEELLDIMIVDALVLAKNIDEGATVVDVGTGAGAPGVALAIVRPDLRITLVEPLAKRVAFLRTVLAALGREDVGLLRMKADELRTRWDVAIARATFPPAEWLARGADLVPPGGSVWLLLAKEAPPEAEGLEIADDLPYAWPGTDVPRRAVRYRVIV
jgi:16S rRNA (guanine527-N7)-methyltransferase